MPSIFKFTSQFRKDWLDDGVSLRVTPYTQLNDPFEYSYIKSLQPQNDGEKLKKRIGADLSSQFGVISFTHLRNNPLMWAHYASSSEGILLEFNFDHPMFTLPSNINFCGDVNYTQSFPTNLKKISESYFLKSCDWAHEKEWRMVVNICGENDLVLGPGEQEFSYKDYLEGKIKLLMPIDLKALKSIIFGTFYDRKTVAKILENIDKDSAWSHIKVYQAELDFKSLKIEYQKIN